jgi:nucleoid DNA-binding protein
MRTKKEIKRAVNELYVMLEEYLTDADRFTIREFGLGFLDLEGSADRIRQDIFLLEWVLKK